MFKLLSLFWYIKRIEVYWHWLAWRFYHFWARNANKGFITNTSSFYRATFSMGLNLEQKASTISFQLQVVWRVLRFFYFFFNFSICIYSIRSRSIIGSISFVLFSTSSRFQYFLKHSLINIFAIKSPFELNPERWLVFRNSTADLLFQITLSRV